MSKLKDLPNQGIFLTAKEETVMEYLLNEGWEEDAFDYSVVTFYEVSQACEIPMRSLRGVLSSLSKKDFVHIELCKDAGVTFIYPTEKSLALR